MDEIRNYLKGRLSEAQAAAFRQRMDNDSALESEVAFARLLLGGLEELSRRKKARRKRWLRGMAWLAILVMVAIAGYWWFKVRLPTEQSRQAPQIERVKEKALFDATVGQGGSDSPERESDRATAIAWNSRGEVILGGQFAGAPVFGEFSLAGFGKQDIFLAAADGGTAAFLWAKQFGSAGGNDYLRKIATDSKDNILVTGGFFDGAIFGSKKFEAEGKANNGEGDFFIAKFDPAGGLIWLNHAGGDMIPTLQTGNNLGTSVVADRFDNVIATGTYIGSPKFGNVALPAGGPNEDVFLAKYTSSGSLLWAKAITCERLIQANGLDADPEGNIFLTGFFGHQNISSSATFDQVTLPAFGGRDIFIAKYLPGGKLAWVRQAGSAKSKEGRDIGNSIAAGHDGSCVVTGFFEGNARFENRQLDSTGGRDVFLAKYDAGGKLLWANGFGGKNNDQGNAVCLDKQGNAYCTGHFTGSLQIGGTTHPALGQEDIFIVKYSPDGRLLWVRQFGGDAGQWNADGAHDIAFDPLGRLVVTGFFSGTMRIGDQTFVSRGKEDVFLLFFDNDGNLLEAKKMANWL